MRKASGYHFYIKKSLHISAILMCAHASIYLPTLPLFIIVSLVFILLSWAIFKGFLSDPISKEKEWGVLYFVGVFAAMLMIIIIKNQQELRVVAAFSLTILAISDGFAGVFGRAVSNSWRNKGNGLINDPVISFPSNNKSVVGFLVFVFSCIPIIGYFLKQFSDYGSTEIFVASCTLSLLLGITEFISKKGSDNLTVTFFAFLLLHWLTKNQFEHAFMYNANTVFIIGTGSMFVLVGLYKMKFLTFSGSLAAWLLAFVVVILVNQSLWPLLIFLLLGSILGKLPVKNIVSDDRFQKPRNATQVFANGGIVLLLGILAWGGSVLGFSIFNHSELQKLMLVSVAVCMADTASSELGSRYGGTPLDILTLKSLEAGVSGGVTWIGSAFGLLGSLTIVLIGYTQCFMNFCELISYVLLGFSGMLLDSFLGAKFQYKELIHGRWQDAQNKNAVSKTKGLSFVTNNMVNFISNILIVFLLMCFYWLF